MRNLCGAPRREHRADQGVGGARSSNGGLYSGAHHTRAIPSTSLAQGGSPLIEWSSLGAKCKPDTSTMPAPSHASLPPPHKPVPSATVAQPMPTLAHASPAPSTTLAKTQQGLQLCPPDTASLTPVRFVPRLIPTTVHPHSIDICCITCHTRTRGSIIFHTHPHTRLHNSTTNVND